MSKILVIEDQPQMRKNLVTILELEGFQVVSAENGRRGVELAKAELPDLILCDVMMPELDGFGVVAALRTGDKTATLPLIFLTAKGDKLDQRKGMNLGADDYLTKPVAREDLLAAVRTRLARRGAHQTELASAKSSACFNPNYDSPTPLEALGLTPREAEVLLWVAQGKSNGDIALILNMAEKTVKKHMGHIFEKLGVEGRNAATVRALEVLSAPPADRHPKPAGEPADRA
jgi:DNA-binding NarL/FixJ family response regulator